MDSTLSPSAKLCPSLRSSRIRMQLGALCCLLPRNEIYDGFDPRSVIGRQRGAAQIMQIMYIANEWGTLDLACLLSITSSTSVQLGPRDSQAKFHH